MKKRLSALFLALALCLGLAVPAFAANANTSAELYMWISAEGYPYVTVEQKMQMRAVTETGAYGKPFDDSGVIGVVPRIEYFYVGVNGLANHDELFVKIMAYSDPDGDGIYDQRLFREQKENGVVVGYDVLPIPEGGGAYKLTEDDCYYAYTVSLTGFNEVGDGAYASTADKLYELFGDNTLVLFGADEGFLGAVLLSAGAFDDVPGLGWYADTVAWAAEKGITTGTGEGIFEPGSDCTQSQILTFLWRAEGKPQAAKAPVTVEEWYQDAINWAYEKGMIDNSFKGGEPCTRATAVQYIWQAKGEPSAAASNFTDMKGYENYAKAVDWANEKKVTTGVGDGLFDPGSVCNRAQIATFLYRAYN